MDQKRLVIIGSKGQLGKALSQKYPLARTVDYDDLDISDQNKVSAFDWQNYKVILNAAAYTNVDGAENEGRSLAWKVNANGPANLARIASKLDITLLHISTDYVFDGTEKIHSETEPFTPLSVYGASKAAGDIAVSMLENYYILRTSWVIGEGKNFVRTMLDLARKGISPTVVNDQIGRPTFTYELVNTIDFLLTKSSPFGTYNTSNSGSPVSWADLTREIFKLSGHTNLSVTNTSTKAYYASKPGVAPRPLNSTLNLNKLNSTGYSPTEWQENLKKYIIKEMDQ